MWNYTYSIFHRRERFSNRTISRNRLAVVAIAISLLCSCNIWLALWHKYGARRQYSSRCHFQAAFSWRQTILACAIPLCAVWFSHNLEAKWVAGVFTFIWGPHKMEFVVAIYNWYGAPIGSRVARSMKIEIHIQSVSINIIIHKIIIVCANESLLQWTRTKNHRQLHGQ